MQSNPRTIRCYSFPAIISYIGSAFSTEDAERIRQLAPEIFERVQRDEIKGDAPVEEVNKLYRAIEQVSGSVEEAYRHMYNAGDGIGQMALSTFLRLVIKFMPPQVFARKCHDFFRKDHSFGRLVLESFDGDGRRFVLRMEEMDDYLYCAPGQMGVLRCMMRAMGHEKADAKEELHPPPAAQDNPTYRIVVTW